MQSDSSKDILVVYYSRSGHVAQLARLVARGVEEVPGMRARLRSVLVGAALTDALLLAVEIGHGCLCGAVPLRKVA